MFRTPYEATSPDGPEHWPVVVAKFKEMVATQPTISVEQLGGITAATLVVVGDDDMITLEHTVEPLPSDPELRASRGAGNVALCWRWRSRNW